jgi:RimJ/RimL family protein N-acetyltransferase
MPGDVCLRDVAEDDLAVFFMQQLDPEANYMAAFTAKNPADRAAFRAHWAKIRSDYNIIKKTILYGDEIAGSILVFPDQGRLEVGYWLGKEYWGHNIATQALLALLEEVKVRPLYARVAKDNIASLRVLGKCGFIIIGEGAGYSYARGHDVDEFVLGLAS